MDFIRVVITTSGKGMDAEISRSFSECPFFAVADISEEKVESLVFMDITAIKQNRAESAIGLGAQVLITGGIAAKDRNKFKETGIRMGGFEGTLQEALDLYIKDPLKLFNKKIYGESHNTGRCYSCGITNKPKKEEQ